MAEQAVPLLNLQPLRRPRGASDNPPQINSMPTSPLTSPRKNDLQTSPRTITIIDSPRPSPETIQRRLSQGHNRKPLSQLRKSQTELSVTHHLKTKEQQVDALKPLTTVSGTMRHQIDLVIKPVGVISSTEKNNMVDSPPLGRLESHIAPMHLLERVIRSPGGGIEMREVLGIYTSKRAAAHAARLFYQEHPDQIQQSENLVELVTSLVGIDKAPSGNHTHETLHPE